jgi:hypothetical protein
VGLLHSLIASLFPPRPEPIEELRVGAIAVVRGRVVPRDLIECPLTGDRCVYYHYTVEDWRPSQVSGLPGDGYWELSERDEAIAEFYVDDGTGRAIVSPHRAEVDRGRVMPEPVDLRILNRRAQQLVIAPGDVVEITAQVDRIDDLFDEGRDYRESPRRLCLRAPTSEPLRILAIAEDRAGAIP